MKSEQNAASSDTQSNLRLDEDSKQNDDNKAKDAPNATTQAATTIVANANSKESDTININTIEKFKLNLTVNNRR